MFIVAFGVEGIVEIDRKRFTWVRKGYYFRQKKEIKQESLNNKGNNKNRKKLNPKKRINNSFI